MVVEKLEIQDFPGVTTSGKSQVVIPLYRLPLREEEEVSLGTVRKHIPGNRITFVSPLSLKMQGLMGMESLELFEDEYFASIEGYNRLLTSSRFYERFEQHGHILICQLDCLVFGNELDQWSSSGFDYVAAPWFRNFLEDPSAGLWRVGNGGFSLRNVSSHLRVMRKKIIEGAIYPHYGSTPWEAGDPTKELGLYETLVPWYRRMNPVAKWTTVEAEIQRYPRNEDLFWSLEAPKFDPAFRVASAEDALSFAFETAPRWCYEKNGRKLPFGCHAWARYDRGFWEQIMRGSREPSSGDL